MSALPVTPAQRREYLFRALPPYTYRPLWLAIARALYG
jgi:hypothetical protein